MKNKITLYIVIFLIAIFVLGAAVSVIVKNSYSSLGIEKVNDVSDLDQLDIQIEYAYGMNSEEESFCENLNNNARSYIENLEVAPVVLVVEPCGSIKQYRGSYSQEVEVREVLKCDNDNIQIDSIINIYQYGGFENHDGILTYTQMTNLMYPDNSYLVFLEESELNTYMDRNEFYYYDSIFSCIKLTGDVGKTCTSLDFNECKEIHYFCVSDRMLESILSVEQTILEEYNFSMNEKEPSLQGSFVSFYSCSLFNCT